MKRNLLAAAALVSIALSAQSLMADHGDNGKKHYGGDEYVAGETHGWQQAQGFEYRVYGPGEGRPPGWSRGKKTGWGNCGLPPGQAKKYGCHTYTYEGRSYYYYQNNAGQVIVRRPTVEIQDSIDIIH